MKVELTVLLISDLMEATEYIFIRPAEDSKVMDRLTDLAQGCHSERAAEMTAWATALWKGPEPPGGEQAAHELEMAAAKKASSILGSMNRSMTYNQQ
ncbi:hypothetical protein BTVI_06830 [Pitangus sulphuratus]|nr:hypothetical protein BTVI_06830 [Pitangus sulphuratus]